MGWATWTPEATYEIERIVGARKQGKGWTLQVLWKGYPEATPEPLHKILRQVRGHPEVLAEIEKCQNDYLMQNPDAEPEAVGPGLMERGRDETRHRSAPERLMFPIFSELTRASVSAVRALREAVSRRCEAFKFLQ